MNASALVRSPLKTSGSSPIGLASCARGTGRRFGGRLGPAGTGSPLLGGPPGGSPPPPPSPPPPRGGPPPPLRGLQSDGWGSSPSSTRLKALSKLEASLVSTSEVVWVTITGGSYLAEYCAIQAEVGGRMGCWMTVGLFLIWLSRAFWSESSIDCSEAVSFPLLG